MRDGTNNYHAALAYAVCEILGNNKTSPWDISDTVKCISNGEAVLVDGDKMSACAFRLSEDGECSVTDTYEAKSGEREDFYSAAARCLLSDNAGADTVFRFCSEGKRTLARYLRSEKTEDEPLFETEDGVTVSCKQINDFYEGKYLSDLRAAVTAITNKTGTDVPVILTGKKFAFYPCEHTVREMLSPMPFVPVSNLIADESLFSDTKDLVRRGEEIIAEREKKKKTVQKSVMLKVKKLTPEGLTDSVTILAAKGDDISGFQDGVYSDEIFVHKDESITVVADSESFSCPVPCEIFENGKDAVCMKIGIGLENEELRLFAKTNWGTARMDTDPRIFERV